MRQIVRERGEDWADYQRSVYGDDYKAVSKSGVRMRHYHHNPVVDRHAAKVIGFRAVLQNYFAKLTRKHARREATV